MQMQYTGTAIDTRYEIRHPKHEQRVFSVLY